MIVYCSVSLAGDINYYFDRLKSDPINYTTFGTICEQVARVNLEDYYLYPEYKVETGIVYKNAYKSYEKRTLGELDIVVFRNSDNKAILIGEVKCWKNLRKALIKAQKQYQRFQGHYDRGTPINMHSDTTYYTIQQFSEHPNFVAISQNGGESYGFDMTLGLTLREVQDLRHLLIDCQSRGQCPSPYYK